MRLLHTSDWHLGRSFHGVALLGAQADYLDHLVEVVRAERIEAVLVAGDVYDRANPSPDAVALLSESLERIVDAGAQVVISSGNHDSATRLGFAGGLLERAGAHVRTSIAGITRPVRIGEVDVHPLPYLEPAVVAGQLEAQSATHAGVLRAAMDRVRAAESGRPIVVMAHAFVTGCATSDSERDIAQGGLGAVPPEVFDGVAYAALGHLHRAQAVAPGVRYCGSPVAMSFSEAGHTKVSLVVEVTAAGAEVEAVQAPFQRPLARLRGDLESLLTDASFAIHQGSWCQITLTDPTRPLGAMDRLRRRFPHTLDLHWEPEGVAAMPARYAARVAERDDLDVCCDFLPHVRGGAPATEDERGLLAEALGAARLRRSQRDDEGIVADAFGAA